jgi:hypothetical protein
MESNTTGMFNPSNGNYSLKLNSTGTHNTAIGQSTLYANVTGGYNTAVGAFALANGSSGTNNSAFSVNSLNKNSGSQNIAMGNYSLENNTFASTNSAFGTFAAQKNTIGGDSVAVGYLSLNDNTTGSQNTAIGAYAGMTNQVGNQNTLIGRTADVSVNNLSNATALGYNTIVNASNKVRIGNSSVSVIEGQVAWSNPSDRRLKENIVYSNRLGLDFINHLNTISYNYIADKNKVRYDGFIAQDVEQTMKEKEVPFSGLKKSADGMYSLAYSDFVMPLVNAVKELSAKMEKKEAINILQQKLIIELQAKLEGSENKKQEEHSQK